MKTVIIKCEGFIIPNMALVAGTNKHGEYEWRKKETTGNFDYFVQMWLHNDESENIVGHDEYPISKDHFHYSLLKNKQEGDVVVFTQVVGDTLYQMEVTLICAEYRYRQFGRFEEVLDTVTKEVNYITGIDEDAARRLWLKAIS